MSMRLVYSRNKQRELLREADDRALLLALKEGEEDALDELIDRKTGSLLKLISRMVGDAEEARDIVQITFVRLWEHRARFDQRWAPNTWIYRIATNLAIDYLRSRASRQKTTEPLRMHVLHAEDGRFRSQTAQIHAEEVSAIFRELSSELSEQQRLVFLLREIEDLPSKEVAEIVGVRESTVRNHLFNARRELRRRLLERYPEYAAGRMPAEIAEEAQ
jgi:RNA polymerase sigma-70 factor (ECF subfamily)